MGNNISNCGLNEALDELKDNNKIKTLEDDFWTTYFETNVINIDKMLREIPYDTIKEIKNKNKTNFTTLCLHCINQAYKLSKSQHWTTFQYNTFNNSIKWLVRLFPVIFEDREMINYLWDFKNDACFQPYSLSLLQCIVESLFRPGFTVSRTSDVYSGIDPMNTCSIWKPGLVIREICETNDIFIENRKNLLSLLLIVLSQELFFTYEESIIFADKFSGWFKSKNNKFSHLIFTSLVNFICCSATDLEKSKYLFHNFISYFCTNFKYHSFLFLCLHVLMLSLCSSCEEDQTDSNERNIRNVFVDLAGGIHRKVDIDLIINAIQSLLKYSTLKKGNHPGFMYSPFHPECLVLLWRFCMINNKFKNFLLISPHMPNIILYIILYLHDSRADESQSGFIHSGLSLILFLSSERQFAIIMNSIYDGKIYYDLPKNSSYNDYLVYCLAKLMTKTSDKLKILNETIASIIFNISPFISLQTMSASLTMICMLEAAVESLSNENSYGPAYKVVSLLLDSFNNILCYGYNSNSYLIFCMILSNKVFYKIDSMADDSTRYSSNFNDQEDFLIDNNSIMYFPSKNIIKFLDILVPQVEKLCEETDNFDEEQVIQFLKRSTVVGIVNKPAQILTRRFEIMETVVKWIHIYSLTLVYIRQNDIPIFKDASVRLFQKIH